MNEFLPNWASPPSDTIKDILEEKNISIEEFKQKMNLGETITKLLLNGKWIIDNEIAIKLSEILGSTPYFWKYRDNLYWNSLRRINK